MTTPTESTGEPCKHCFCSVDTAGNLRCHRCGASKPYEPPPEFKCFMCGGTGMTRQAYGAWEPLELPEDIL